jgi:hypothetical protein
MLAHGGGLDLEDEHDGASPARMTSRRYAACPLNRVTDGRDIEGEDSDREPSLGWPERVTQTPQPDGSDDRELSAEAGARLVRAARKRPRSHARTDHSGRHVDVDDSRVNARHIRNLSPKQEKLAPRIDRGEVRI